MTQETRVKATFPSIEWLQALRDIINADEVYKRIGTCDAVVGLKVPDRQKFFLLTFEAFEVLEVKEVPEGFARSRDGYRRDAFYRFNQSFQHFFDSSAKIDTSYA